MKIVLLFAFLAFTATATDYHLLRLGFNDQFSFSALQRAYNKQCFQAVANAQGEITTVIHDLAQDKKGLLDLITVGAKTFNDLKAVTANQCFNAAQSIAKLGRKQNPKDAKLSYREIAHRNARLYSSFLIQQTATFIDSLQKGNEAQAGEQLARIVKVLVGLETPKAAINLSTIKYVAPKNINKSANDFSRAFLSGLNIKKEDTIKRFAKSLVNFFNIESKSAQYVSKLGAGKNVDEKVKVITESAHELIAAYNDGQVELELVAPILASFRKAPQNFVYTALRSLTLHLVEVEGLYAEVISHLLQDKATSAGVSAAKIVKIVGKRIQL